MHALLIGTWHTVTPAALVVIGMLMRGALSIEREKRLTAERDLAQERLLEAKDEIGSLRGRAAVTEISTRHQHPSQLRRTPLRVVPQPREDLR
jgi:hypothetical protein